VEQELQLTDLSSQVTAIMPSELLKYEMLRMLPDFSLNVQVLIPLLLLILTKKVVAQYR
jgi:hypothetical protein